jgi:hypothetical protein
MEIIIGTSYLTNSLHPPRQGDLIAREKRFKQRDNDIANGVHLSILSLQAINQIKSNPISRVLNMNRVYIPSYYKDESLSIW